MNNKSNANPENFTEYSEANETENYDKLTTLILNRMQQLFGNADHAQRDTHAKSHAAVKAHIEIFDIDVDSIKQKLAEAGLSETLIDKINIKQGLFAKSGLYSTWLRFANGNGGSHPDSKADTRSMSVKIMGVEGTRLDESYEPYNQDIITQNCDIFFIDTIADYFGFLSAIYKSKLHLILWLLMHLRQAIALRKITKFAPKSLLTERYWSGSAYSLGVSEETTKYCPDITSVAYPAVVKYAFTPITSNEPHSTLARQAIDLPNKEISENHYRDELISQLVEPGAKFCWDFGIQFQMNGEMPIDNLTIAWSEQQSPVFTVGRLTVEQQEIDFDEQREFCENLTFAPWHGLAVHRPVGALNRLRKFVYPLVASFRHEKNQDDYQEPRDLKIPR